MSFTPLFRDESLTRRGKAHALPPLGGQAGTERGRPVLGFCIVILKLSNIGSAAGVKILVFCNNYLRQHVVTYL